MWCAGHERIQGRAHGLPAPAWTTLFGTHSAADSRTAGWFHGVDRQCCENAPASPPHALQADHPALHISVCHCRGESNTACALPYFCQCSHLYVLDKHTKPIENAKWQRALSAEVLLAGCTDAGEPDGAHASRHARS